MQRPFEGEKVRLRAREESDVELMYRWVNHWETARHLASRYPQGRAYEAAWLRKGDASFQRAPFIIETLSEGRAIGWCSLNSAPPEDRSASLGIAIGEADFLGGGFGTDATRIVCRVGFEVMNLHRIDLTVYDWNTRAIRCYEKVGFQPEGLIRDGIFKDGRWNQLVYMGLLRGELR